MPMNVQNRPIPSYPEQPGAIATTKAGVPTIRRPGSAIGSTQRILKRPATVQTVASPSGLQRKSVAQPKAQAAVATVAAAASTQRPLQTYRDHIPRGNALRANQATLRK